eukprot:UN18591
MAVSVVLFYVWENRKTNKAHSNAENILKEAENKKDKILQQAKKKQMKLLKNLKKSKKGF